MAEPLSLFMLQRWSFGFFFIVAALAIAVVLGNAHQWQQTMVYRSELELARTDVLEFDRLKAENQRLRAQQVATPELERLRADHAALPRLRAELEALKQRGP